MNRPSVPPDLGPPSDRRVQDLGKYRLVAELARGGMGVVYLALTRGAAGFTKLVVIKELRPHFAEDGEGVQMFLDEARLAARLNHPNIVQTFEVGAEANRPYLAMEYLEGESLHRLLRHASRGGQRVPLGLAVRALVDTLAGLHYAHCLCDYNGTPLRVVHRDVSPQNVFVTYEGQVKVVDFGIAKAADSSSQTRVGMLKGKIAYMAPEQARGEPLDARADVFAVGVMLWEAITGQKFWSDLGDQGILHHLIARLMPEPPALEGAAARVMLVARRAVAYEPEERFASAEEMQLALEALLPELSPTGSRELGRLVSDLFGARRVEVKAMVDTHLRQLDALHTGEFSALEMLRLSGTQTIRTTPISQLSAQQQLTRADSAPTFASQIASVPPSSSPPPSLPSAPRRSALARLAPVALVLGVVGGALAGWRVLLPAPSPAASSSGSTSPLASAPPSASPPSVGVAASAETILQIIVRATPSSARISIDGGSDEGSPLVLRLRRDDREHVVRVAAPGHAPRSEVARWQHDQVLDIALDRLDGVRPGGPLPAPPIAGRTAPSAAPAVPATASPPATAEGKPEKATRPRRNVDRSDPYAN